MTSQHIILILLLPLIMFIIEGFEKNRLHSISHKMTNITNHIKKLTELIDDIKTKKNVPDK